MYQGIRRETQVHLITKSEPNYYAATGVGPACPGNMTSIRSEKFV